MTRGGTDFDLAFEALTGYSALRWQRRLFDRLTKSIPTKGCDLPTGLGKTSIIPIWLIALASRAESESVTLPRRLIYIVNRRTVVDQATRVVEEIRRRLLDPTNSSWQTHAPALRQLVDALQKLSANLDDLPLAISTLRGELADNEEWKADPARAAIIVGTIDMIGSKLLFSGYGDGRYHRTHHAGLIGQDSLIVHDEAHLTPAFSELLRGIADAQDQSKEKHSVRVMELSATMRGSSNDVLALEPEDEKDGVVQQRLNAEKNLRLHEVGEDKLAARLVELALKQGADLRSVARVGPERCDRAGEGAWCQLSVTDRAAHRHDPRSRAGPTRAGKPGISVTAQSRGTCRTNDVPGQHICRRGGC